MASPTPASNSDTGIVRHRYHDPQDDSNNTLRTLFPGAHGGDIFYIAIDQDALSMSATRDDGAHIFYDEDLDSGYGGTTRSANATPVTGAQRLPAIESVRSAGTSSVGTPARSPTAKTASASTASSVTLRDGSEVDVVQRRPAAVDTARMDQMQLLSDFLEMHFPSRAAKADLASRQSYLLGLPEADLASSPMLRNAVQAICYAHAGSNYKDKRLVRESQKAYGKVLNALVRSLDKPNGRSEARIIVPSIMLLTLYDDALPNANSVSSNWRAHYWGVHDYLKACGPSAFQMSDPFSRGLFINLRIPNIFLGITRRKAVVLSEPQWQVLGKQIESAATSLGRLYPRALPLPGLLEKADQFLATRKGSSDGNQIMKELMSIRAEFVTWSNTEAIFSDRSKKHYDLVNISNDDAFDFDIEEHLVMTTSSTFESYFDFSSYKVAQDYALYWMFALIVDCTLLRLIHFRPECEAHIKPRRQAETQRDAANRAKYLCRAAYFFSKFGSQGITSFLETLIAMAESFFSEVSAAKEFGWCQSMRVATKLRLKRLRKKQPKTLCRMGDMVDDMAAATRFRSRYPAA